MNSAKRTLCILLLIALLSALFCGCDMLDQQRLNHATWEDENTVLLEGKRYLRLPYCDNLYVTLDYQRFIYATQPDVPVLLRSVYGDLFAISDDGRFLQQDSFSSEFGTYSFGNWFCLEENYPLVMDKLEKGYETSGYFYEFEEFDSFDSVVSTHQYELTPQQVTAIDQIVYSVKPTILYQKSGYAALDQEFLLCLKTGDEQRFFAFPAYDIYRENDEYYLVDLYSFDHKIHMYTVPDSQKQVIKQILETFLTHQEEVWDPYDVEVVVEDE